ncbi:TetR/AcrR family transcriptional regulator [Nonomuraea typhae]|uniref:TetR/AcrR family transcriptional regulator n=1 Tax=Nonomuraea typhae TaxID=2603600 RepID=UPI0012F8037D|nr:helix-turn-helix domain-containing protein [Nonomuraea typhae]
MSQSETKERILEAALEQFTARGYRTTSMREIAEQVGLTKPTLYHYFRSKSEIIQQLLDPLLDSLDAALEHPETFLERCVDTMVGRRRVLTLLLRDTTVYAEEEQLATRVVSWMERANALLAGPEASWPERIRAAQALAAVADPLVLSMPVGDAVLKGELLRGARLLLAGGREGR